MSSPPQTIEAVPSGHVRLILVREPRFYLEIPLDIISSLCLKPRKYLVFLGWCILAVEGGLARRHDGEQMGLEGDLDDEGLYYYVKRDGTCTDLSQAVDIEVIKQRSNVPSEATESRSDFRNQLLIRDGCCVFTGSSDRFGSGLHIIPYRRGSEWFRLIIENRPKYGEQVEDLVEVNDVRNGVFANDNIHRAFDPREVAILKTPNHVLIGSDIPQRARRAMNLPDDVSYPDSMRYTLQWLINQDSWSSIIAPNNVDATFKTCNQKPHPSDLLLHYNYGAAAVKRWGHGTEVLQSRPNLPRPTVPMPAPMGPTRTVNNRSTVIQKRDAARHMGEDGSGNAPAGDGSLKVVDLEDDEARWEEDDVMLFLWGNSQAALERHQKKQDENTQYMEQWRQGVLV